MKTLFIKQKVNQKINNPKIKLNTRIIVMIIIKSKIFQNLRVKNRKKISK